MSDMVRNIKIIVIFLVIGVVFGCEYESDYRTDEIHKSEKAKLKDTLVATEIQQEYRSAFDENRDLIDLTFFNKNGQEDYIEKGDTCNLIVNYRSVLHPDLNKHYSVYLEKVSGEYLLNEEKGKFQIVTFDNADIIEFNVFILSDKYVFKSRDNKNMIDTLLICRKSLMVD